MRPVRQGDSQARTSVACGRQVVALAWVLLALATPGRAAESCPGVVGDCNSDGTVDIAELVRGVSIALGAQPVRLCRSFDQDGSGRIEINELIDAVGAALFGCSATGICLQPSPQGLIECAEGTSVRVSRCDDRSRCLEDTDARTLIDFGMVGRNGGFSLRYNDGEAAGVALLFEVDVAETTYRLIDFGPVGAGAGLASSDGAGSAAGMVLTGLVVSPVSEAAVRLLDENGLENFADAGVVEIKAAVDGANEGTDFAGLGAEEAAVIATEVARLNEVVQDTIERNHCPGDAVTLCIGAAVGEPGQTVTFAVTLRTAGTEVVGVENQIVFSPNAPIAALGGRPDCQANPAIGKNATTFDFLPLGCDPNTDCHSIKALVLDFTNVSPIPDHSVLYSCRARIRGDAPPGPAGLICREAKYSPPPPPPIPAPSARCTDGRVTVATGG